MTGRTPEVWRGAEASVARRSASDNDRVASRCLVSPGRYEPVSVRGRLTFHKQNVNGACLDCSQRLGNEQSTDVGWYRTCWWSLHEVSAS